MPNDAPLSLPARPFGAYLFDCDGTLADTMPLHYEAWNEALSRWGCRLEPDLFYGWAGIPLHAVIERLNETFGLAMPVEAVVHHKESYFLELLAHVRPIAPVVAHVELQFGKLPLAVVSGSPRATVIKTLATLGLLDRFDAIVGAEDATRGKPHPEPFLTAAAALGVAPQDCLVFEDAELGIAAAQAAGMAWVRVPTVRVAGPTQRRNAGSAS